MVRDDEPDRIGRRRLLRGAAAGLFAATVPAGAAAANESERDGPVRATGRRVHRFEPDGDAYVHRERFVSPDLRPQFGRAVVAFDPVTRPADRVPEEVRESKGASAFQYRDTGVFGTFDQHAAAEQQFRGEQKAKSEDGSGPKASSHSPYYAGPLYTYKSGSVAERTAPINVAWRRYLGLSASEVRSTMVDDAGWGNIIPSSDRYVIYYDGNSYVTEKQDNHVKKSTGVTAQWHGRLYDVPAADDDEYGVACQAHHDPWDHGYITDPDWRFADSRRKFLDAWESVGLYFTTNRDAYNGYDFASSNGLLGVVY